MKTTKKTILYETSRISHGGKFFKYCFYGTRSLPGFAAMSAPIDSLNFMPHAFLTTKNWPTNSDPSRVLQYI